MRRLAWLALLVLAGCTSPPTATVVVEFSDGATEVLTQSFDATDRPSAPEYEAQDATHPDFYSVHDLVYEISQDGPAFTTQYFEFDGSGGFFICSIDGKPALDDGACPSDVDGFYEFHVDGESSDLGMSDVEVENGGKYSFVWTPFE